MLLAELQKELDDAQNRLMWYQLDKETTQLVITNTQKEITKLKSLIKNKTRRV